MVSQRLIRISFYLCKLERREEIRMDTLTNDRSPPSFSKPKLLAQRWQIRKVLKCLIDFIIKFMLASVSSILFPKQQLSAHLDDLLQVCLCCLLLLSVSGRSILTGLSVLQRLQEELNHNMLLVRFITFIIVAVMSYTFL